MGISQGFSGLGNLNVFSAARFEDLINRRGWVSVLWDRAVKCSCYSEDTGNPDPKDPLCGGIGWLYIQDLNVSVVAEQVDITLPSQTVVSLKGSLTGSPDPTRTIASVSRIYNETQQVSYTIGAISGLTVALSGAPLPQPGDKVVVDYIFLRDAGASIKAVFLNVDYQRDFIPAGEWLAGDAIMTVSGQYKIGFRDRITIPEQVIRTDELLRRNEIDTKSRSLERLRYKTGLSIVLVRDLYRTFALNTDFTIGADATIVWGAGARPKHKIFNITYSGDATSALLVVTNSAITVTLVGQTDGSADLSVPFATYPTNAQVVAFINSQQGYAAVLDEQSNRAGIQNSEDMAQVVPISSTSILNILVDVYDEDRTQYTVEYMHDLAYSVYMKQGMVRRLDNGTVLPGKYWLRLWEFTNKFSDTTT